MAAKEKSLLLRDDDLSRNKDDDKYQKKGYKTWSNKQVIQHFQNQPEFAELSEEIRVAITSALKGCIV